MMGEPIHRLPPSMEDVDGFVAYIQAGGKVEAGDWMPEEYKNEVIKIASFQAILEVVPMPLFRRWMYMAPTLWRRRPLLGKIQDEVGHCHITARMLEDLGKSREELFSDYLEGRIHLNYPFKFPVDSWGELPAFLLLTNSAAVVQFRSLAHGSYLPYCRVMKKIMREESFHFYHALQLCHELVTEGTPRQRAQVQEGLAKWWHIAIYQFGPPEHLTKGRDWRKWRVKVDANETLRQQWISMLYPIVRSLGVEPDPNLERDPDTGEWRYSPLDWDRFFHLIRQRTPLEEWYVEEFKRSYENDQWALKALKELPLAA